MYNICSIKFYKKTINHYRHTCLILLMGWARCKVDPPPPPTPCSSWRASKCEARPLSAANGCRVKKSNMCLTLIALSASPYVVHGRGLSVDHRR